MNKITPLLPFLIFFSCSINIETKQISLPSSEKYLNEYFKQPHATVYITHDSTLVYETDPSSVLTNTNKLHTLILMQALCEADADKYTHFNKIKFLKKDSTFFMNTGQTTLLKDSYLALRDVVQCYVKNDYNRLFSLMDTSTTISKEKLLTHCTMMYEQYGPIEYVFFNDFTIDSDQTILYKGLVNRRGRNALYEVKFNKSAKVIGGSF